MKNFTFILILLVLLISFRSFGQSNSIEIWIRAFIPNPENAGGGSGYILALPSGGSAVKIHNVDPSIPLSNICFLTDNRGFSDKTNVTSRLETKFRISLNGDGTGKVTPVQYRTISEITKEVDCDTGAILAQKMGSIDMDVVGAPAVADGVVQVVGQVRGTNLLTPLGAAGPSINYDFDLKWNPSTSTVVAAINIGSFPAHELYARQPGGRWVPIFQQLPVSKPWTLGFLGGSPFGITQSRIVTTKVIPGIMGNWQTPAPEKRFTLEFVGKKVKWTERSPSGATLTKEVDMMEISDGKFKIERANTEDVLKFLGFQPTLCSEILARGPNPSFIMLNFDGDIFTCEWNGLIAIKGTNAHLQELVQPGVRPPKIYNLNQIP